MTLTDSNLWIVYNGEIYNFIELRKELESKGQIFRSQSDTEVILAAYRQWGTDAFRRFNGMWAFAIYDQRNQQLLLCRDRYGIKPLYYMVNGEELLFGSELKVFRAVSGKIDLKTDLRAIATALRDPFQLEASSHTLIESVMNLPAGHFLSAGRSGMSVSKWWNTLDHLVTPSAIPEEQAEAFYELFLDACRLRMRSDVPIGTSLSGGLDSSSVVVMLRRIAESGTAGERVSREWQKTFIHTFPDTPIDETAYANIAADAASAEKVYVTASAAELVSSLDDILWHFEGIYGGMPDSLWRVYKAQRENGVVVSLDGHGADEMLAGYNWHVLAALSDCSLIAPRAWALMKQYREMLGGTVSGTDSLRLMIETRSWSKTVKKMLRKTGRSFSTKRLFMTGNVAQIPSYEADEPDTPREWPALNRTLYSDFHYRILPRILKNFDLMSMAHGVEVRMPFMDYRLVNFVFSLPAESKIGEGYTKLVLRRAMKGILPESIRLRKTKIGFNSPMVQWFRNELREWIECALSAPNPVPELISVPAMETYFRKNILTGQADWDGAIAFWKHISAMKLVNMLGQKMPAAHKEFQAQ